MKKILSLVLVLSLVLGTFSFAFAATPEDVVDTDYEKAVETLMALGVVDGYPDGTYKPEKAVTRAEMAKLLIEALGYGELAEGATASFTDAQGHWAESYIGFAASMDIVIGYPDGTFKPDSVMSTDEAITMVVRALGYTDESLKGTWPTNYKVKALDLELTDGLTSLSGDGLRGNVALLLYNALELPMVEVDSDGNADKVDPEKLFIDNIGTKVEGVDGYISYDDVYDADNALVVADGIDLEQYLYNTLTYYSTDDYDVAYVSGADYDTYEGTLSATGSSIVTVKMDADNSKTFNGLSTQTALFYNGVELDSGTSVSALEVDGTVEVKVVYDDDNNDALKGIIVWKSEAYKITNEYSVRRPLELQRVKLPVSDDELDTDNLTVEGAVDSIEDIAKDDIIHIYSSDFTGVSESNAPDKMKIVVVRDTFEGKVTKLATDGTQAVVGGSTVNLSDYQNTLFDNTAGLELGTSYTLYYDKNGDVFAWTEVEEDAVAEGYGVYVAIANGTLDTDDFDANDVTVTKSPRIKIFTSGGDVVTYNIDADKLSSTYSGIVTLGSIKLEGNGTDTITASAVDPNATMGALISYELNSDGEVNYVTTAGITTYGATAFDDTEMLLGSYDVEDNTIIFNLADTSDETTWEVVEIADLTSNITGEYAKDGFNVSAMTVASGLEEGNEYAVVIDAVKALNEDDETVYELTVLHDGVEKTFLTSTELTAYADFATTDGFVELTLESGEVTTLAAVAGIPAPTSTAINVESVESTRIQGTIGGSSDGDVFMLADDVVVYIVDDGDYSIAEGNLDSVLEGDYISLVGTKADGTVLTNGSITTAEKVEVIIIDLDQQ